MIKEGGGSYFEASDMGTSVLKGTNSSYLCQVFQLLAYFFLSRCLLIQTVWLGINISGSTRIDNTCKLQARQDCLHRSQNLDVVELKQHYFS